MKNLFFIQALVVLLFWSGLCVAIEAFESDHKLIVNHPQQSHILNLPNEVEKSSAYSITIFPNRRYKLSDFDEYEGYFSNEDVQLLIYQANEHFQKNDYNAAMKVLMKAYQQAPSSTRVNNMIGSVFYALKDYEMARKYWVESLNIDENQPQLKQYIDKLPETGSVE